MLKEWKEWMNKLYSKVPKSSSKQHKFYIELIRTILQYSYYTTVAEQLKLIGLVHVQYHNYY
jgi:hypothetical protein